MRLAIAALLVVTLVAGYALVEARLTAQDPGVPVLLFHQVVRGDPRFPMQISESLFRTQIAYLRWRGFHFATTAEVGAYLAGSLTLPRRTVLITFDDGYADNYDVAYPILRRYGARATVFTIASLIGKSGYLTPAQVGEMKASGLVEFQNHTNGLHYRMNDGQSALVAFPVDTVRDDLLAARGSLRSLTSEDPTAFAYPYGQYRDELDQALQAAGQTMAFTTERAYVAPGQDPYRLPRFRPPNQPALFLKFIDIVEGYP